MGRAGPTSLRMQAFSSMLEKVLGVFGQIISKKLFPTVFGNNLPGICAGVIKTRGGYFDESRS